MGNITMTLLPIGATPCPECPEPSMDGHKVTFMDYDGSAYYIMYVEDGGTAYPPEEDPDHSEWGLSFVKWQALDRLENVTSDLTIQSIFRMIDSKTCVQSLISPYCLNHEIKLNVDEAGDFFISWGDGSSETKELVVGNNVIYHEYNVAGDYFICITPPTGYSGNLNLIVEDDAT